MTKKASRSAKKQDVDRPRNNGVLPNHVATTHTFLQCGRFTHWGNLRSALATTLLALDHNEKHGIHEGGNDINSSCVRLEEDLETSIDGKSRTELVRSATRPTYGRKTRLFHESASSLRFVPCATDSGYDRKGAKIRNDQFFFSWRENKDNKRDEVKRNVGQSAVNTFLAESSDLKLSKSRRSTSLTTTSSAWRGKEQPMFDEDVERIGCVKILESLTDEEKTSMPDVSMAVRYLRAEKGSVENAVENLRATLRWRKEWAVDAVSGCFGPNGDPALREMMRRENATGKVYVRGYDRNGRAVVYFKPGRENTNATNDNDGAKDCLKHVVYHLERAAACTARTSGLSKTVMLVDFDGYRLSKAPSMSISRMTVDALQNHYPEQLHRFYICNPPLMFRGFWNLVSPFVDPVTKEKIVFCSGKDGGKILEKDFVLDDLEVGVGGTGANLRPFDSEDYLTGPYAHTFDEISSSPGKEIMITTEKKKKMKKRRRKPKSFSRIDFFGCGFFKDPFVLFDDTWNLFDDLMDPCSQ